MPINIMLKFSVKLRHRYVYITFFFYFLELLNI